MSSMVGAGASHAGSAEGDWMMPPLSMLLKRELTSEQIEKPDILHGLASRRMKGEDLTFLKTECQHVLENGATIFSVFALFDSHNGLVVAIYAKESLLNNILCAIPSSLTRDEWLAALP